MPIGPSKAKKKRFNLYEDYEILEKLGEGASSIVRRIRRKVDGQVYALKTYKMADKWPTATAEGHIIDFLDHPNIIKFIKFCKTKSTVSPYSTTLICSNFK
jgi:serine/threonine protein kinase